MYLPDYLQEDLKVIFIGYNPGLRSAETGHHYAGKSNRFWKLLYDSGLTPELYRPEEDYKMIDLGFGLTNIVARPTKGISELSKGDYAQGRERLLEVLSIFEPKIACYVGIGVYKEFSKSKNIKLGLQPSSVVEGVLDFAVPSSSGLNRMAYKEQLQYYLELKSLLK